MDEAVETRTYRAQHIGGPYDGAVEDRELLPTQEKFQWVQKVYTKDNPDAKPFLLHNYNVEIEGRRALLRYRGYAPILTNPFQKISEEKS